MPTTRRWARSSAKCSRRRGAFPISASPPMLRCPSSAPSSSRCGRSPLPPSRAMPETPEAHTPRFLAWLYSTPSQQPVLAALCGIEREIGASLEPGLDHHVAHTRLQWWREELDRFAAGKPVHPLTRELQARLPGSAPAMPAGSPPAGLSGLVDAATWDLAGATFERREELTAYCRRWAAAMVVPLGAAGVDWTDFGAALCELELLGHLDRDARAGRLRVPLDELERAAVAPQMMA